MEWNTVERAHKDRNRHKNRLKRSGRAWLVNVFDVNHNNPQQVKVNPPVRSCEDNSKVIKSRITVWPRSLCAGRGLRESMKLNEPETQKLKRNPSWRWVKHAELCYGLHLASKRRRLIALGSGFRATGTLCHRGARFLKCIYLLILLHFFLQLYD